MHDKTLEKLVFGEEGREYLMEYLEKTDRGIRKKDEGRNVEPVARACSLVAQSGSAASVESFPAKRRLSEGAGRWFKSNPPDTECSVVRQRIRFGAGRSLVRVQPFRYGQRRAGSYILAKGETSRQTRYDGDTRKDVLRNMGQAPVFSIPAISRAIVC